jgi:DNA-binding NarL/FixJ family response regulator
MPVRVLIADDHAVVRDGLKMIIEANDDLEVVGTAVNGHDAIAQALALRPDVVLMDIAMPELNGIEASRLLNEQAPAISVIILSMHHTREHLYRALRAGVRGYLLKESAGSEVVKAIRAVVRGQQYLGKGIDDLVDLDYARQMNSHKTPLESLSQREREVMQYVAEGKTSAEIAAILSLSPKSVETYRSRLMLKLGLANVPALVKFALQHGLTPAA